MIASTTANGLPALHLHNVHGEAIVHRHGAHVTHFQPAGQRPVLWLSDRSPFQDGKPIRGGVPICAPWFGPHPTDPGLPAHGLVRTRAWAVVRGEELPDGRTRVELALASDPALLAMWPHPFAAALTVTVGATLELELSLRNTGSSPILLSEALHSYFAVSDVRNIRVTGLGDTMYLDKVAGGTRTRQGPEPIAFIGQTDRVYFSSGPATVIDDPGLARRIVVSKSGSGATVVWNPWAEKAATMSDVGADAWPGMVCVEAANAADSTVVVPPDFTHHLRQVIAVEAR